ncbi:hypothetical protein [Streptomyces sp. NPDC002104]
MSSSHVLIGRGAGRGTTATLEAGHLRIQQGPRYTLIPLAAVQEARAGGESVVEVVLTDGAAHRVHGGNPTAAAAFAAALTRALPRDRDPAGSALVTTGSIPGGEPVLSMRRSLVRPLAVVLAYAGYTIWAGATHGASVAIAVALNGIPILLGLTALAVVGHHTSARVALARRGITVQAVRAIDPLGRPGPWYEFTAMDGVTYRHHTRKHKTPTLHVVHDPLRPYRTAVPGPLLPVVLKYTAACLCAGAVLALGAVLTYEIFW